MTSTEDRALALVNEVQADWNYQLRSLAFNRDRDTFWEALCRAIEQHEAFRQEVSDAVEHCRRCSDPEAWTRIKFELERFIITKPDPLDRVLSITSSLVDKETLRDRLEAEGLEIREKSDDN